MFYFQTSRTVEENFFDMLSVAAGEAITPADIQIDDIVAIDNAGGTAVTISSKNSAFATGSVTLTYNRINMNRIDDWPWSSTISVAKPNVRTPQGLLDAFNTILRTMLTLDDLEPIDADAVPPGPLAAVPFTAKSTNPMLYGVLNI